MKIYAETLRQNITTDMVIADGGSKRKITVYKATLQYTTQKEKQLKNASELKKRSNQETNSEPNSARFSPHNIEHL